MIFRSHITTDSPRAVQEILKTLARLAGEREDYATWSASALERWRDTAQPRQTASARERLEAGARIDRSKADTARHLLVEAWIAAGYDDGRQWIPRVAAERFADAMIEIVLAERDIPGATRLELDDIFTGAIEVEVS
ncbi:hypothetical protein OG417_44765 [Actinoallomurus sp. NBC_01490]|uniref:hypothetical protein n=1 Tax=Actinoallomurus sp. NBC_01490 TaxID=2903557 RepID=UPI002E32A41F|nr:hypothetical protein [Actinoallomurus sp. NBC_01490]